MAPLMYKNKRGEKVPVPAPRPVIGASQRARAEMSDEDREESKYADQLPIPKPLRTALRQSATRFGAVPSAYRLKEVARDLAEVLDFLEGAVSRGAASADVVQDALSPLVGGSQTQQAAEPPTPPPTEEVKLGGGAKASKSPGDGKSAPKAKD